jgi:hypothetical protein
MKIFRLFLFLIFAITATTCSPYDAKKVVGDPGAFGDSSSSINLLPSLDIKCGGSNCITR